MQQEAKLTLIKGNKIKSFVDYRDFLPINMVGIVANIFGIDGYMWQWPGLTQYGTLSGFSRGAIWNERFNKHYRVAGNDFIEIDVNGNVTVLGTVSGSGFVSMPNSFLTQAIIADGKYYLYDPTNGLREVVTANLGTPIDAVWVNGVYFFTDGESLYHTDSSSESTISVLQFATAEFMPDAVLGVGKTQDNKVIAFGRYSVEYFVDQSTDNFRFRRVESRAIKLGIAGTYCKKEIEFNWYILGGAKEEAASVYVLGVGSGEKIATREIERIINQYDETQLSNAYLEVYSELKNTFLIIHLPNEVLAFNVTFAKKFGIDQAWSMVVSDNVDLIPWRAIHGIFDPRKKVWCYGDKIGMQLGYMDETKATHYDEIAQWVLATPFIILETFSIDELEIETIPGLAVVDNDATVFLSMTVDGQIYSNEKTIEYGQMYHYNKHFIARKIGYISDWFSFKFRGSSRTRMAFSLTKILFG